MRRTEHAIWCHFILILCALIGISQRDINYYEFLADMKDELETTIHEFFEDRVRDQFEGDNCKHIFLLPFSPLYVHCRCLTYPLSMLDVFDVYILQNRRTVKLVDFNPFSPTTDGLIYDWSELYQSKLN